MMVEARKDDDERPQADAAADLSRFAESSTKLFAEQAAVMAVMTAYGMSVAAQMTGMMLGSLRGPVEAGGLDEPVPELKPDPKLKTVPAEERPASAERPSAKVVPLRPRTTPEFVPSTETAKPRKAARPEKAKSAPAKPVATKRLRSAEKADDLKKISGIGPRLEQVLNERGIKRYADVATMSKAALKKLDADLGLEGRTIRDDWASQARALSGGEG